MYTRIHYRDYNPKQLLLFPERLDKDIDENDPVRVVDRVIDGLKMDNFSELYNELGRNTEGDDALSQSRSSVR